MKKEQNLGIRPLCSRVSGWNNRDEVLYSCPACGTSFNFYSVSEHFCHNCGQKINWGVIGQIDDFLKDFSKDFGYYENLAFCMVIDKLNEEYDFDHPVKINVRLDEDKKRIEELFGECLKELKASVKKQ